MAIGGGSADRKAEELAAAGDPSAAAWAAGAAGERRVADELAKLLEAWTVFHDRLLSPGLSPVNLDHVVVGPGGAFLIDAKNWSGNIAVWQGNLFQHLGAGEGRQSLSKHQEVAKVHGMAAYMAAESGMPVAPVICLAGRSESNFGEPQLIRGVWVIPASNIRAWLDSRPVVLQRDQVERSAVTLMTSFPSTTTDPQLLSAMGAAATKSQPRKIGPTRRAREVRTSQPTRRRSRGIGRFFRKLLVIAVGLAATLALIQVLPGLVAGGLADAVTPGPATSDPPTAGAPKASASPAKSGAKGQKPPAKVTAPVVPVSTCANLTAVQVGKIIGRSVQPVVTSQGCAWGTRLDDATTTLVTVETRAEYAAYDKNFTTSQSQRRTVFGAYYINWKPATALWVVVGQPIGSSKRPVLARLNTHVVVSTKGLKVSDDRARTLATAVAVAVNRAH